MTLANWGGIKAELLADTNRASDAMFALRIPAFLERALQRIHNGGSAPLASAALRTREMRATADLAVVNGSAALPNLFLEADYVYDAGRLDEPLPYVAPWQTIGDVRSGSIGGYTIEGTTLKVCPVVPTATLKLVYFKRISTPAADSDTNWLMTQAPSVLFDAIRVEAYQYLRNAEMTQVSFASFASAVNALQLRDVQAAHSGSVLAPSIPV